MSFPWPSFGAFKFSREESAIHLSDSGWNRSPSYSQTRALGSAIDSVVTLAVGSLERSFDCYLTPTRYAQLSALVNTVASFTDWERPVPASQDALLLRLEQREWTAMICSDGTTQKRIRTKVSLLSQMT